MPKLSQWINGDSIRVKGSGKATILEVHVEFGCGIFSFSWNVTLAGSCRAVRGVDSRIACRTL